MPDGVVTEGLPLKRLTGGDTRGWCVALTWLEPGVPSSIVATHKSLGVQVIYGMLVDENGGSLYDVPLIKEVGGGGATFIPYSVSPHGELFVGAIYEKRPNMGPEPALCIIGGFNKPGESHRETLVAEASEEAGIAAHKAVEVEGAPVNPNREFFFADASRGEGVRAYTLQVPWKDLELDVSGRRYLSPDSRAVVESHNAKAKNVIFFPHDELARLTSDGLLLAAMCRLRVQIGL